MELKEALLKRRSIRKFTDQEVSLEDIETILHMAMSGPSAMNKKPWEFYVVTNQEKLAELRKAGFYKGYESPLAIVVCGNIKEALPLQLKEYWIQDCSAATENILLAATDLGLGSVWCGVYPQKSVIKKVQVALGMPSNMVPLNIIYIGYPDVEAEARDQFTEKKIHYIK